MFKGKRGLEYTTYYSIWQIIALFAVILVIIVSIRGFANNTSYWKKYYSSDLGLMADIENINQGDFVINYALKEETEIPLITKDLRFEIFLEKDNIAVSDSEKSRVKTTYPFSKNKEITVLENSVVSDFLVLSKIKSELMIGTYQPKVQGTAQDVCPSIDTAKSMDSAIMNATSLSTELNGQKASIDNILKQYGRNPSALPELTIITYYNPKNNFTIYYSNDLYELKSQKLSCILGKGYLDKYPDRTYYLSKYDGFLDQNTMFKDYLSKKSSDEFWIIISESDVERNTNANDFAGLIDTSLIEFFK
jgi:hypothetical protein